MRDDPVFLDYLTSLGTVPNWEFDEYKEILEETVEDRLEEISDCTVSLDSGIHGLGSFEICNQDHYAVERRLYNNLLDDLEDIESKRKLMEYTEQQVETPESSLPAPFNFMRETLDFMNKGSRADAFEMIYEEATVEFQTAGN